MAQDNQLRPQCFELSIEKMDIHTSVGEIIGVLKKLEDENADSPEGEKRPAIPVRAGLYRSEEV